MKVKKYLLNFLGRKSSKKSGPTSQEYKFYTWDNIPLKLWLNLQEDVGLLVISGKPTQEQVLQCWIDLLQGYINQCGLAPEFKRINAIRRKIAVLEIDIAVYGKSYLNTEIKILLSELQDEVGVESDLNLEFATIEKFLGFSFDSDTILAKKYYSYINLMKKDYDNSKKR